MHIERNCNEKERAIWQVQKWLRAIAKSGEPIPMINPDGIYGEETKNAVRIFQGLSRLDPTGVVDYRTWCALHGAYNDCMNKNRDNVQISPFDCHLKDGRLRQGDEMPLAAIVQAMIEELRMTFDDLEEQKTNGVYDDRTARNIAAMQRKWGLAPTGELDKESWNRLAACFNDRPASE